MLETAVTVGESTSGVPPRIAVRGDAGDIAAAFPVLAGLEPIAWIPDGLVLAPFAGGRDQGEQAARLAALDLPWQPEPGPSPPLPFPAAVGGGVYRRSPGHAPAPAGLPEIVLMAGEGFGLAEHPTTGMCLDLLPLLPDGDALDAGCGSGTLALAWARLGRGAVIAVDLDPRAVAQARESAWASGLDARVTVRRGALGALPAAAIDGRVVMANAPLPAQLDLLAVTGDPVPTALLLSGLQPDAMDDVTATWSERGLREARREGMGRWQAAVLVTA